ncbi:MAG: MFS transporter, partial [Caulobacteraceae bacterium]
MSAPRSRPELRRLPFGTRVLYGVGSMANASLLQTGGLVLLFYNQIVGLNAALAGLALAICTFVDAFWDPLVGWFSDHLGSRLGRRHPLMYLSAVPVSLTAVLVFDPPRGLSQAGLFGWLLVTVMACRMSISLYEVPSGAL